MNMVIVRNTVIGEGRPKICIPIVAQTEKEILSEAKRALNLPADVVEWRADWYTEAFGSEKKARFTPQVADRLTQTAGKLREALGDLPLLFTFRTEAEGGERSLSVEEYEKLNLTAAESGFVDLVDAELFTAWENMAQFCAQLHARGVQVIGSSHDFRKTPSLDEIVARLRRMQEEGVDIAKMAVMPQSRGDVLTLLSATLEMHERYPQTPVITMSMGAVGSVSRLVGECFGSALTFGSAGQASAPGQIAVEDLARVLDIIHGM